ncbi:MAG: hypothetical protein CMB75_02230 [Euryarchaeota archaeon]|nr:hypothetical protein [Euryarchaeota archaeon]
MITKSIWVVVRGNTMSEDVVTSAAQHITRGDYMSAMSIFEEHVSSSPDDPAGYHGWAEAALFEIQENGNLDDKGNDRINEGQVQSYLRRACSLAPENADYRAAYANALIEFDRIPMAVRELRKLVDLGTSSEETDISFHLYEAARLLIESIDVKTNFDRSAPIARQFIRDAVEFSLLGLGFQSVGEAMEYLVEE